MNHPNQLAAVLATSLALVLAGCGREDSSHGIAETRALDQPRAGHAPEAGAQAPAMPEGFVHPPMTAAADPAAVATATPTGALRWTPPQGWIQGPARPMRLVSFSPPENPGVDCYVTVLGGDGGGIAENVNRWRSQLKLAALSDEAVASLPRIRVLGRSAPMVEIDGGALGLYGVVCPLGDETIFVKMTGPTEALRADRATFIEFCKSLSQP